MATSLAGGRTRLVVKPVLRGTRDIEPGVSGSSSDAVSFPGDGQARDISGSASEDGFEEVSIYTNELWAGFCSTFPRAAVCFFVVVWIACRVTLPIHTPHTMHRSTAVRPGAIMHLFSEQFERKLRVSAPHCQLYLSNYNSVIKCVRVLCASSITTLRTTTVAPLYRWYPARISCTVAKSATW